MLANETRKKRKGERLLTFFEEGKKKRKNKAYQKQVKSRDKKKVLKKGKFSV